MLLILTIAAGLFLLYGLYRLGYWVYEVKFLTKEERWKKRYDRKLKSFHKHMDG